MTKAKEYADRYRANPSHQTMAGIASDFYKEVGDIARMRHASSDAAMASIFDEQDQKWKFMAHNLGCAPDGFRLILREISPDIYDKWMELRANNGRPMPKPRIPSQLELDTRFWLAMLQGKKPWQE